MEEFNFRNLGESINSIRVKLGVSQKDLSHGICSQSQISKIESGEISPYIHTLVKISQRLGISVEYFINQVTKDQYEFIAESKNLVRGYVKDKDYKEVKRLIKRLEIHPTFQNVEEKQFLYWHEGFCSYYLDNDFYKAIFKLKEALNLKESIQATEQDIQIKNSIGIIYGEEMKWEEAQKTFLEAIQIFEHSIFPMDYSILTRIYYNLSKVLYKNNQSEDALNAVDKGINLTIQNESSFLMGELLYQKGLILGDNGNVSKGIDFLKQAANIFSLYGKERYLIQTKDKIGFYSQNQTT